MKKKNSRLSKIANRWFIDAFSGMAHGLFATLIAGTILAQISLFIGDNYFGNTLNTIASIAKSLMGAGIGIGIAYSLKKNKLVLICGLVAGMVGAFADKLIITGSGLSAITLGTPGNPIGAYVVTILVLELTSLYEGKTKLDILLVPLGTMLISFIGVYVAYPFIFLINELGLLIALATNTAPFIMGIIIAAIMGILLTLPTSSAAIWISVAAPVLTKYAIGSVEYNAMLLAGGAATVGCACHMVGFAFSSFKENRWSGVISQGLGTSMLQIPNVMKKPIIMLPEIIASIICGPLSTCVFHLYCNSSGGGMGTSGLVGIFGIIEVSEMNALTIIGMILLMFILPALISVLLTELLRKKGYIKKDDLKLKI